jgi:hypothetical protein
MPELQVAAQRGSSASSLPGRGAFPQRILHQNVTRRGSLSGACQASVQQSAVAGLQPEIGQKTRFWLVGNQGEIEEKPEKRSKKGQKYPKNPKNSDYRSSLAFMKNMRVDLQRLER